MWPWNKIKQLQSQRDYEIAQAETFRRKKLLYESMALSAIRNQRSMQKGINRLVRKVERLRQYQEWSNQGVILLMTIMNGRAEVGESVRAVYDKWRSQGTFTKGGKI